MYMYTQMQLHVHVPAFRSSVTAFSMKQISDKLHSKNYFPGVGEFTETSKPTTIEEPLVGEKPRIIGGMDDVSVMSPHVANLECQVKPGADDTEITWYVRVTNSK